MKTTQEFWDEAILAAVSNMAGRRDYGTEFPDVLVNDAERIADALTERRRERMVRAKTLLRHHDDETNERFYSRYDNEPDDAFYIVEEYEERIGDACV